VQLHGLRIRALLGLKRQAELPEEMRIAAAQAQSSSDWTALAAARESTGDIDAGVGLRVKAMCTDNQTASASLQKSHGLIARIPSGPISAPPVVDGFTVLLGDNNGVMQTIDPATGQPLSKISSENGIYRWWIDGHKLVSGRPEKSTVVRELVNPPTLALDDPLLDSGREQPLDNQGVAREWYTRGGMDRIGVVQAIDGRLVRPMADGGVRELVNGRVVDAPGLVNGMDDWRWVRVSGKWYAIGQGGVYLLDQSLRPAAPLIRLQPGPRQGPQSVWRLAGNGNTFCLSVRNGRDSTLQLWAGDGSRQISSTPVIDRLDADHEGARLLSLNHGYLLSAGEIVYLALDPSLPVRRFSLAVETDQRQDWRNSQLTGFGVPRVLGQRLIVSSFSGGIYDFELSKFVQGTR
jgi:hypothetical protein